MSAATSELKSQLQVFNIIPGQRRTIKDKGLNRLAVGYPLEKHAEIEILEIHGKKWRFKIRSVGLLPIAQTVPSCPAERKRASSPIGLRRNRPVYDKAVIERLQSGSAVCKSLQGQVPSAAQLTRIFRALRSPGSRSGVS